MEKKPRGATRRSLPAPVNGIERRILVIRGLRVMLDSDLAELYGVETGALNRAVRRNVERFPPDFMFTLSTSELGTLRCQSGISKSPRGGRRYASRVFTEQGVAMLSSVLHSRRAAEVNIAIMRAFVRLREILSTHKDLARRIDELERKYDGKLAVVFDAIRELMTPASRPEKERPRIGFTVERLGGPE
jgi:hypothetical protein